MILVKFKNGSNILEEWERYEHTARLVLERVKEHFGLSAIEGPQTVHGRYTNWKVDAKGIEKDSNGIILVECRLRGRRQTQEDVAGLALRIIETEAKGAILVTPVPLQRGASALATGRLIRHIILDRNSTPTDFALRFLKHLFLGVTGIVEVDAVAIPTVMRGCMKCGAAFRSRGQEMLCQSCAEI